MSGTLAVVAEVAGRVYESSAEVIVPEAVGDDAGREGIARIGDDRPATEGPRAKFGASVEPAYHAWLYELIGHDIIQFFIRQPAVGDATGLEDGLNFFIREPDARIR